MEERKGDDYTVEAGVSSLRLDAAKRRDDRWCLVVGAIRKMAQRGEYRPRQYDRETGRERSMDATGGLRAPRVGRPAADGAGEEAVGGV